MRHRNTASNDYSMVKRATFKRCDVYSEKLVRALIKVVKNDIASVAIAEEKKQIINAKVSINAYSIN